MTPIEIISIDLFNKIRSRFQNLQMGDSQGAVTIAPKEARFFDFEFDVNGESVGRVSASLNDDGALKLFFSQDIVSGKDEEVIQEWYQFLREMRLFAKRRLLRFDARDITKGNLDKLDFQYLSKKDTPVSESNMFGSSKTSYRRIEDTDLIIRHTEAIDPSKPGARSRKIRNLFIQNKEGERFKFPFIYLPGARAMQRHVANGGYPHDDLGKKILKNCEEVMKLRDFGRKVKHSTLNDDATQITQKANEKLQVYREHIHNLSKQNYYEQWAEQEKGKVDDSLIELDDTTFEQLKNTFTVSKFDESLAEVFPILQSIMKETEELDLDEFTKIKKTPKDFTVKSDMPVKEFYDFAAWTNTAVIEAFNMDVLRKLEDLMKNPLPVGANGEAVQALLGIGFNDPTLINAINSLSKMPNGASVDAREIIHTYMGDTDKENDGEDKAASDLSKSTTPSQNIHSDEQPEAGDTQFATKEELRNLGEKTRQKKKKNLEIIDILSGFYNRQDGTWTKGEHGVITHVRKHFSQNGGDGEKEAQLAAKLIQGINEKNKNNLSEVHTIKRLAGI